MRKPSPAGYCLTPTAELAKTERGPISTIGVSISVCHQTGDPIGQIELFLPARHRPTVDLSLVARRSTPETPGVPAVRMGLLCGWSRPLSVTTHFQ